MPSNFLEVTPHLMRDSVYLPVTVERPLIGASRRSAASTTIFQTEVRLEKSNCTSKFKWISAKIVNWHIDAEQKQILSSYVNSAFGIASHLHRIEASTFEKSCFAAIHVPECVELLCKRCFSNCMTLTSVTLELNSKLKNLHLIGVAQQQFIFLHLLKCCVNQVFQIGVACTWCNCIRFENGTN
jgi:hypothetical protein